MRWREGTEAHLCRQWRSALRHRATRALPQPSERPASPTELSVLRRGRQLELLLEVRDVWKLNPMDRRPEATEEESGGRGGRWLRSFGTQSPGPNDPTSECRFLTRRRGGARLASTPVGCGTRVVVKKAGYTDNFRHGGEGAVENWRPIAAALCIVTRRCWCRRPRSPRLERDVGIDVDRSPLEALAPGVLRNQPAYLAQESAPLASAPSEESSRCSQHARRADDFGRLGAVVEQLGVLINSARGEEALCELGHRGGDRSGPAEVGGEPIVLGGILVPPASPR